MVRLRLEIIYLSPNWQSVMELTPGRSSSSAITRMPALKGDLSPVAGDGVGEPTALQTLTRNVVTSTDTAITVSLRTHLA